MLVCALAEVTVLELHRVARCSAPHTIWALCTVARTGSSWLCELLHSTDCLGYPDEYLLAWPRQCVRRGLPTDTSLEEYLSYLLYRHSTPNGVFAIKGSWTELAPFLDRFPHAPCIWLSRENKLEQAVSWYRAHDGGRWTRTTGADTAPTCRPLEWSLERALWFYHEILRREAEWHEFFLARRSPPLMLTYEAICQQPLAAVRSIATYLGVSTNDIDSVHSRLGVVRDEITPIWVSRLAAEVSGSPRNRNERL
jgi:LPS sulfotransferase NodH